MSEENFRNLNDVIEEILKVSKNRQLNIALNSIKESFICCAPEMVKFWWSETFDALRTNIPDINKEWEKKVFKIFTTKDFE